MKLVIISFVFVSLFYEFYSLKLDKFIFTVDENLVKLAKNSTYYHKNQLFQGVRSYLTAFKKMLSLFKLGRNKVMKLAKQIYEKEMPYFVSKISRGMQNIVTNLNINTTEDRLLKTIIGDINATVLDFRLQCKINPGFVGESPSFSHTLLENTENRVLRLLKRPRRNFANELIFYANKYYALLHALTRKIKSNTYHYLKVEYLYNAGIPTLLQRKINFKKLKERVDFAEGDIEFFEELMANVSTRWNEFMDAYAVKLLHHRMPTASRKPSTSRKRRIKYYQRYMSDETKELDEFTLTKRKYFNIYLNCTTRPTPKPIEYESIDWYDELLNRTTTVTIPTHPTGVRYVGYYKLFK